MKSLYTCLTLALLNLFIQHASAQNMNAVNNMFQRQNTQMQMNMQMQGMLNRGFFNPFSRDYNYEYRYVIIMADSSKKQVYSKIYLDTAKHKNYLLFVDKSLPETDSNRTRKIYPGETRSIERSGVMEDKWYKGMPKDTCWMFKVISGSINAYSFLSEADNSKYTPGTLVSIQKNDGPILKLNEENLLPMISNDSDPDIQEYIQEKNYYKAIKKYNRNAEKAAKK